MDILDRLLGHDTWTTRQLLLASQSLPDDLLDKEFDIDHKSLRETFIHVIENMEIWTDLLYERAVQDKTGNTIPELLERLSIVSRDFANLA
ncbi:MAG: DinB family protein, partial [Anaerolineae bacterium]